MLKLPGGSPSTGKSRTAAAARRPCRRTIPLLCATDASSLRRSPDPKDPTRGLTRASSCSLLARPTPPCSPSPPARPAPPPRRLPCPAHRRRPVSGVPRAGEPPRQVRPSPVMLLGVSAPTAGPRFAGDVGHQSRAPSSPVSLSLTGGPAPRRRRSSQGHDRHFQKNLSPKTAAVCARQEPTLSLCAADEVVFCGVPQAKPRFVSVPQTNNSYF
jgi:hypothetical protein